MLISLAEYAAMHSKSGKAIRDMALRKRFKTAQKIGSMWIIDDSEPYPEDQRIKTGKYKK